ncbi:hypothetical protein J2857_004901 [Neorhizobium galegae]|uniref:hypothetical protein n=1 Tax=Neorhizobium galegae TaxID=399 RepID=UPI001AE98F9E|nr:hypothetical protein [Neorhizobium galegae]MBP2562110.1 hypothetical protein [Neorhizobium galegae]
MTFVNRKTGAEVRWGFIDQETGEQVSPTDLEIIEGPGADELVRWRLSHATDRHRHQVGDIKGAPASTDTIGPVETTH